MKTINIILIALNVYIVLLIIHVIELVNLPFMETLYFSEGWGKWFPQIVLLFCLTSASLLLLYSWNKRKSPYFLIPVVNFIIPFSIFFYLLVLIK